MPISPGLTHPRDDLDQIHFIDLPDLQIAYRETGSGPPIVFVHGFASSSYTWNYLVKYLPQYYRYILLDLKGFGDSDKPSGSKYRAVDQASVLKGFLKKLGLEDVVLIGHSFGGAVVLSYLLEEAESKETRIQGLVLVDTPGYQQEIPPLINRATIPFLSGAVLEFAPAGFLAKRSLRDIFFDPSKISTDLIEAYARPLKLPGAKQALMTTAKLLSREESLFPLDRLSAISLPTLIIWGEHDTIVPLHMATNFSTDIPNSVLRVISNCGHAPQEESPKETAQALNEFLHELKA
jgi:pimeloyl-ACP methyl ester carboxylesterase